MKFLGLYDHVSLNYNRKTKHFYRKPPQNFNDQNKHSYVVNSQKKAKETKKAHVLHRKINTIRSESKNMIGVLNIIY